MAYELRQRHFTERSIEEVKDGDACYSEDRCRVSEFLLPQGCDIGLSRPGNPHSALPNYAAQKVAVGLGTRLPVVTRFVWAVASSRCLGSADVLASMPRRQFVGGLGRN